MHQHDSHSSSPRAQRSPRTQQHCAVTQRKDEPCRTCVNGAYTQSRVVHQHLSAAQRPPRGTSRSKYAVAAKQSPSAPEPSSTAPPAHQCGLCFEDGADERDDVVDLGVWRPLHLHGRAQRGHALVVAGRQRDALVVEVPWPAGAGSLATNTSANLPADALAIGHGPGRAPMLTKQGAMPMLDAGSKLNAVLLSATGAWTPAC